MKDMSYPPVCALRAPPTPLEGGAVSGLANPVTRRPLARRAILRTALGSVGLVLLAGCAVGPRYERPDAAMTTAFKEAPAADGWVPAQPGDALDRGDWWSRFGDPQLDALAARVQVSNQNIAAAVASYAQGQALVREQQAALFPTLSVDGSARRSGPVRGGGQHRIEPVLRSVRGGRLGARPVGPSG